MKTVRRLLYRQILSSVLFVTLAFLALFFFIDLVDELQDIGRNGYTLTDALWTCILALPGHVYDVFPITLLIGTIMALSQLAQSSEYTILRTSGLGPGRALKLLAALGVGSAVMLFAIGDFIAPWTQQMTSLNSSDFRKGQALNLGKGGAWLRETSDTDAPEGHQLTVNVGSATGESHFKNVRIFEFDNQGRMVRRITAQDAEISHATRGSGGASLWTLSGVSDTRWASAAKVTPEQESTGQALVSEQRLDKLDWVSQMTPQVVAASVLPIDTMSTAALWRYTHHLARNAQAAQKYELQFWKKAFSPLTCLVMVALALPFAYLQSRNGGMNLKVFGGVMLGISFVLVNHITSHLSLLHQWQPWLAASAPSIAYLLLSLSAFVWLVRNR